MAMNPLIHLLHGAAKGSGQIGLAPRRFYNAFDNHAVSKAPLDIKIKRRMLPVAVAGGKNPGMTDYDTTKRGLTAALQHSRKKQSEIAREIGESPQAIGGWLKTGKIKKDNLRKFAAACGVTADFILNGGIEFVPPALPDMGVLKEAIVSTMLAVEQEWADLPAEGVALLVTRTYQKIIDDKRAEFETKKILAAWSQPKSKRL